MLLRAVIVWCALLAVAIINGAARETWMTPAWGARAGHALSTLTLCAAILLVSWLTIAWIHPANRTAAFRIGLLWLALTLAFEFLAGHYLFDKPWSELLADYDVLRGRIWILALVTTALAPVLTACGRMWR
jgi:hypothetical protein